MDFQPEFENVFNVAGMFYRQDNVAGLQVGQDVCLEPEPTNVHDAQAIQVLVCPRPGVSQHIGYVPARLCPYVHACLQREQGCGIWDCRIKRTWEKDGKTYATIGFVTDRFIPKK